MQTAPRARFAPIGAAIIRVQPARRALRQVRPEASRGVHSRPAQVRPASRATSLERTVLCRQERARGPPAAIGLATERRCGHRANRAREAGPESLTRARQLGLRGRKGRAQARHGSTVCSDRHSGTAGLNGKGSPPPAASAWGVGGSLPSDPRRNLAMDAGLEAPAKRDRRAVRRPFTGPRPPRYPVPRRQAIPAPAWDPRRRGNVRWSRTIALSRRRRRAQPRRLLPSADGSRSPNSLAGSPRPRRARRRTCRRERPTQTREQSLHEPA
jgi:hypothetical protein